MDVLVRYFDFEGEQTIKMNHAVIAGQGLTSSSNAFTVFNYVSFQRGAMFKWGNGAERFEILCKGAT